MMRIAFVCDWGESSEGILERYRRQTPGNSGVWGAITGVGDHRDCDLVVVLGGTELDIDKSKALLIHREPDFIRKPVTDGYRHYVIWQEGFCGVTWWLSSSYDELVTMEYPDKEQNVSCIVSGKHAHRNEFVEKLVLKKRLFSGRTSSIVDLYGRGLDSQVFGSAYKGAIEGNGNCKLAGLSPYRYSIVLENSQQKNYWTEKLADAILAWCIPVYWGCPNIDDFFDEQSVLCIGEKTKYRDLAKLVSEPITDGRKQSLAKMRMKIINEFNIWNIIAQKLEEIA